MYEQIAYTGLNSWFDGFWGKCKSVVKSKAFSIGAGLVFGSGVGLAVGILAMLLAPGLYAPLITQITDNYQPKNEKERQAILFWNENLYIPFILKIEALIIGTNQQKNEALRMMAIYEAILKEQLIATKEDGKWFFIDNISYEGLLHRYAYVLDIHKDIRNMLTIQPSQKTTITTNTYLQEFTTIFNNGAYTEIAHVPNQVEVLLLPADAPVVDIDLNLPPEKDKTEDLTTKATAPTTADGKDIAEAVTEVIKTKATDIVKVEITDVKNNNANLKEVVTITAVNNADGTKTKAVVTQEINNAAETKTKEVVTITEPSKTTNKSGLVTTFKQAVVFAVVAVAINKIAKNK